MPRPRPVPRVLADDLGHRMVLPRRPQRLVSLVPSLTEALAATVPDRLVGATDWCTHPADLAVARVRGTKNPDRAAIAALAPDLVETLTTEDLPENWAEDGLLTKAIRDLVPEGPDAVIDYLPSGPGTWQAVASMRPGGSAVIVGGNQAPPTLPALAIMVNSWSVVGTRSCTRSDALELINLLRARRLKVDDLITHRFPLHDANTAMEVVRDRSEPTWMVVAKP